MPKEISSMDLLAVMQELQVLEGARIDKFYQRGNELVLYAYNPGDRKYRLFMTGGRAFLTDYKREMPDRPPGFCMALRKQLGGKVIDRIEQHTFDRILTLHTADHVLVIELFNEGNAILTNKNGEIQHVMDAGTVMGRDLYPGEPYEYPESGPHPGDIDTLDDWTDEEVVVALAREAGIGGRYAEEVCARADVGKNTEIGALPADARDDVIDTLHHLVDTLTSGDLQPRVYHDQDGPVVATPVPFHTFDDHEHEAYDTFSGALDAYYTEAEKAEARRRQRQEYEERKEKLERRLDQQQRKLEGLRQAVGENKEKGDLIYEHYGLVEEVLDSVRSAVEQYTEEEVRERLESEQAQHIPAAEAIQHIDFANRAVTVDLDDDTVKLDLAQGVEENAERYYEKSTSAKQKIAGLEDAIQATEQELAQLEPDDVDVEDRFENKREKKEKKQWYEKFRWCVSSDGYLIIAGRDTTTNDMVVKKYMENGDRYVHADFQGAPSVVVKAGGDDLPDTTLKEAGIMAVSFARSWEAGVTAEDAYHVAPDQVTQEPESGEYLPKGSFVIRGDRTYMNNLPVEAAIGAYDQDGRLVPMGGPVSAVQHHCDSFVVLAPGRTKKSDVAKTVKHHLDEQTGGSLDLDAIIRAMPPGESTVKEKR